MRESLKGKKGEFLFSDENVKYSVINKGDSITIDCEHPIFINRFKSNSVNVRLEDLFNSVQKGSADYTFFQKFKNSLQEHFLDREV